MSRKRKRMQDIREAKDKRMKKVAVGGVIVLAAVLAFEVPHVLKRGGAGSPSAAATTTSTTATPGSTTTPTAPTTTPGAAAAAVLPTSLKLPNSDTAPERSKSQLYSFSRFSGKNPWVQQVVVPTSTPGSPTAPTAPTGSSGSGGGSSSGSGGGSPTLATAHAAMISVNGKTQTVLVGASFPHANPLFKLVAISHNVAKIGLVSGKFANGAKTVSLGVGKSLILVDKANNAHYQLKLLSVS